MSLFCRHHVVGLLAVYLVALNQKSFQSGDFSPQFSDQPDVGVLVDGGLVDDVLGPVGVAQSAERLAVVHVCGRNVCDREEIKYKIICNTDG